jgi:molybdopterin-binding protein
MATYHQLLTAREAAQKLGVSYPTIKKWILDGKIKTVKTPGGHHRVTLASLKPYLERGEPARGEMTSEAGSREMHGRVSGRNQLPGTVTSIRFAGFMAEVVLAVGEWQVTAIITAEAVKDLQLQVGDSATALIKSTDVMIHRLDD